MIDKATQQKIKDTADIVEVVSDYVHLIRSGSNYKGLCPFHNERTPSFSVNKAKNFCFCFSCKKGGSPINFIMEKEGVSYYEALRHLAKKYGIKIEEKELTDEERLKMERKESMYVANEWAMHLFQTNLSSTDDGRDIGLQYLYSRGVTQEAIEAFHIGYALDKEAAFIEEARKKGFNINLLKELGLVGTSQNGRDYDRFRGRIIFPIMSSSHKVVGFGGRTLKQGPAKYVNSPESEIYKKSNELYGMSQARQTITSEDNCYLVEGYLDVIGMWQSGIKNVVASSGTALTDNQIALIHRFTKNVTLIYDGDEPGIHAALRGMDMLLDHNLNVSLLLLPNGEDPDSFARKHTPDEFKDYISKNKTDVIRFKARVLMERANNDPQKRISAIKEIVNTLAHINDKVKRDVYIQECSRIMNISEEAIISATADAYSVLKNDRLRKKRLEDLNMDLASGRISQSGYSNGQPRETMPSNVEMSGNKAPLAMDGIKSHSPGITEEKVKINNFNNPLRPLEWKVIQYCLKYGFLNFCKPLEAKNKENELSQDMLTVVEYVQEEISNDNLSFSEQDYAYIFTLLLEMLPAFRSDLDKFKVSLEETKVSYLKSGFDEIAGKNLSIAEIRREENRLMESVNKMMEDEILKFSRNYPSKLLASHQDSVIRKLTNEAVIEPHQLSQIYSRAHPVESEEDKLYSLLPSSILVWKNGILDIRIKKLYNEFKAISGKGNEEEEKQIQSQLQDLIRFRSEFAKNIGDRIICPVPPGTK